MLLLMFLWLRRTVSWFRSPEIVVDNVEHIAMNKELKVLMKAREYSGMAHVQLRMLELLPGSEQHNFIATVTVCLFADFQAHATIVLITDLCLSKTTFHPDLLHFSRIHFNQYTTAEAKEVDNSLAI